MKDHLGYVGDAYVTGWIEQMYYKVQYWEICEHDDGTLVNDQLDAQLLYCIIRLLQSSTCFEQRRAHHQEVMVLIQHLV